MFGQRLSTLRSRILLLVASTTLALIGMSGEALANVPISGPGGWQTGAFTVTITDGYSYNNGATMSCSDSGGNSYMTYYGAGPNSGGVLMEQQWYVYGNGVHTFNCTVWNSNRTASDTGSATFYEDNMTPWANINVGGGTMGANGWYTSFPSVWGTYGNVGPSGTWSSGCGGSYNPGSDWWTCSITDYNNLSGSAGTTINYDPDTPYVSTNVSGGSQANGWYGTAPSISTSTSNVGPSGIAGGYPNCTGLSNGSNSVTCSVRDNNGLGSTDSATTIKLDNQTPSNTAPSSTGTWYTSLAAIPTLSLSASEAADYSGLTSIACTNPDNGSAGNYSVTQAVSASASLSGTYPTSDLAIGTNNISCTSTTGAGNTRTSSFTVLYDPQAPTAQISTSASASTWYSSVASIPGLAASGTVGISGVKTFTCSGDGISSQSYANNTGGTVALTGLNQGAGTITCTLTANNGLTATTSQSLHLDSATPAVAYDTNVDSTAWYTNTDLPTVTVNGSTTGGSGIDHLTCNGDGLPSNYTISAASGSLPAADLNQGTGQITCSSTSGAGLTSRTATLTVKIDDTVPTAALTSTINPSTWYQSDSSIPAATVASTAGPSGIYTVYCSAPGLAQFFSTGSGTLDLGNLHDGTDTVACTPTSNAGLSGTPVTVTVNVDSQAPALTITGASQTRWYDSTTNIPEIDTNATTGPSGLSSIGCSGDGIVNQAAAFSGAPINLTGLNQGTGTITCTATSGSGLTTTRTFVLNLDGAAPSASWATSESQTRWYGSSASVPALGVSGTTTGGSGIDHIACSGDGLSGTVQLAGANPTVDTAHLPNGSDTITCAAVSGAGVSGPSITRTIQVDNTVAPIQINGPNQTLWYPSAQTVTADASADSNPSGIASVSCAIDGGTASVTSGDTASELVSTDGTHTVACQPLSGADVQGQTQTTIVKIDSQTPTVTQTVVPAGPTDPPGTVDVQVAASEASSLSGIASTSCSLDGQTASVASGNHQTVSIQTAGAHTLDCTATTGAGVTSADASQAYTVNADPSQYSLGYGAVASSWQTGPVSVPVSLSGATAGNYQKLTCTLNGGAPTTINGTSGTITVAASGTDKLSCFATASNGADTAAVQQLVRVDNQTPSGSWSTAPTASGEKLTLLGSEPTPLSGIASESCTIDGGTPQASSSSSLTLAVAGNGTHQIACTITTAAGVSANINYTAHVAVPVLSPSTVSAPDPGRWYRSAQSIVIAIPSSGPTVVSVVCSINGTSTTYPVTGATLTIPASSDGTVSCYDVDATGAQSSPVTFTVNIDSQPPTGYFVQTGPNKAIAAVTDPANGSGIQSVTVQYQVPGGQWVTLTGSYDPTTGEATSTLPSSLQQPGAQYSLQALAVDNAGNRTVISTMQDGSAASSSVPNPDAGASVVGGLAVGAKAPTLHAAVLTAAYGQPVTLSGTLTLASGQVAGQTVLIVQKSGATVKQSTATTDANGAFSIRLPLHANSTITYTVDGVSHTLTLREHGKAVAKLNATKGLLRLVARGATGRVRYAVQRYHAGRWLPVGRSHLTTLHGTARLPLPASVASLRPRRLRIVLSTQTHWEYLNLKVAA